MVKDLIQRRLAAILAAGGPDAAAEQVELAKRQNPNDSTLDRAPPMTESVQTSMYARFSNGS